MSPPTVLELFAGIGGMTLGLERAGFRCVGQVEINPWCRRVLAKHWPEVPRHDDVRTAIEWWDSEPRPRVDCVAGGYPCQPESTAGHRRGTDDERWLWPEMARVIAHLRPRLVIGENVLGHRTKGLRFVLRDLERLGYAATPGVIEARQVGAPHIRKRIFTLAHLANAERESRFARWAGNADQGTRGRNADRGGLSAHVSDSASEGWRARRVDAGGAAPARGQLQDGAEPAGDTWWAAEPDVGRVAYGVPGRVDRLRGLGNAVVPAVAEHIGRIALAGLCDE